MARYLQAVVDYNKKKIEEFFKEAKQVTSKLGPDRRTSVLPVSAKDKVDITEVDNIITVEHLQKFVQQQPLIVLQIIESLRSDRDTFIGIANQAIRVDKTYRTLVQYWKESADIVQNLELENYQLKNQIEELLGEGVQDRIKRLEQDEQILARLRAIPSRESSASTRKEKWPDTPIFSNDGKISFTVQSQAVVKKCKKNYSDSLADQIDYIF